MEDLTEPYWVRSDLMTQFLSDIIEYLVRENRVCTARKISGALSIAIGRVRSLCNTLVVAGKINWSSKMSAATHQSTSFYYHLGLVLPTSTSNTNGDRNEVYQHIYNNPGCELCLLSRNLDLSVERIGSIVQELIRAKRVRSQEKQLKARASLTILFCC